MSTVQMNVRIDDALKASGDTALSTIGYSPTRAVRSLWQFLANNAGNEKALRRMMQSLEQSAESLLRSEKLELAQEGAGLAQTLLEQHHLKLRDAYTPLSKEEARDAALRERFEQKGLL